MPLATGQILRDRYRIARLLGQGGFGAVYRAWDMNLDKLCALKENLDTSENAQRQFKREARMLSDLSHPNLPRVIDHFIIPGQGQYLVMDFIEGQDLQEKLAQAGGQLAEAQALDWIIQVCEALEYLHSQNPPVIHRDIKPANIKITPQGRAVLVDFGIAKAYDPAARTTVGARAVTPGFSPLEQYSGSGRTDARTDLYALGATLYMLLTGQAPPEAPDRNLGTALAAPRQLNPAVSPAVEQAVLTAMALLPENRYPSARAMRQALQAARQGASNPGRTDPVLPTARAAPPSFTAPPQGPAQALPGPAGAGRSQASLPWGWMAAAGALVVCMAAVWGLVSWINRDDPQATQTALAQARTQAALEWTPTRPPATTEAPWTEAPAELPTTYTDAKGVAMALVPAGEFQMGSQAGDSDEKPVHTVYLDAFYMDIYEVTNALYEKCVQAGVCSPPGEWKSYSHRSYYFNAEYDDYPVIYVDWEQARTFCEQWRGARLPTEAEWEKAARGGLEGRLYPWGDQEADCSRANFNPGTDCVGDTSQVGSYAANGYGLFDMAGNVWEWVWDWYLGTFYSSSPLANPQGAETGDSRVVRGGTWSGAGNYLRSASRDGYSPAFTYDYIGFRCARSP